MFHLSISGGNQLYTTILKSTLRRLVQFKAYMQADAHASGGTFPARAIPISLFKGLRWQWIQSDATSTGTHSEGVTDGLSTPVSLREQSSSGGTTRHVHPL
jgi:hypothetical protein